MTEHESQEFESCAVCRRSILRGETLYDYVTPAGEGRRVCALCRDRADADGWIPAAMAAANPDAQDALRSRGGALREGLARASRAAASLSAKARRPAAGPNDAESEASMGAAEPEEPDRRTPIERALDAFNASDERRKVGGLNRSLGEPSVAVEERGEAVSITVGWELSWYRWEVDSRSAQVSEVGKGAEIEEIEPAPSWNAQASDDGGISVAG